MSGDNLITPDEAIKMLRLDAVGLKRPDEALRHLRRIGKLEFVRVGKKILYSDKGIEKFIQDNTHKART